MNACWPLQMPPTPKAVLISLADKANEVGYCWPSLTTICDRTCFGRTAVIDAIKWLEAHGALRADRSNRYKTSYTVTPAAYAPSELVRETDDEVRQADTNHQEPSLTTTKSNHQRKRAPNMSGTRFDEFWTAYPVKTEKRQCAELWLSENLDQYADAILVDISAKRESDKRWLGGYVPNARTYLNQERWNDPVQPQQQHARRPSVTDQFTNAHYESSREEELPESLRSPA
nr:helix-turn-helix domain-containing protein [Dyella mobilis]